MINPVQSEWTLVHEWLRSVKDDKELGRVFREYVEESCHSSWEGFSSRDMTGVRKMLVDLATYHGSVRDGGGQ
jgi:hypothetical protein